MKFILLSTADCHLCEQAEALIHESLTANSGISIELIDIAEQSQWQQDYATKIPVLVRPETLQSLDWPFTKDQILTFISCKS